MVLRGRKRVGSNPHEWAKRVLLRAGLCQAASVAGRKRSRALSHVASKPLIIARAHRASRVGKDRDIVRTERRASGWGSCAEPGVSLGRTTFKDKHSCPDSRAPSFRP